MKKIKITKPTALIVLCWLVYTCSYIGKLSYSANINQIRDGFGVSYAEAGMVSTFFFFAYGIGQIVNGIFCKKYNIKYIVFASLTIGSIMNLVAVLTTNFAFIKYIWMINGIAMSVLWTSLIRLLSETLDDQYVNKAILAMGTTVATGTFFVYGLSSLFVALFSYRVIFIVATITLFTVALIWFFSYNTLTVKAPTDEPTPITEHPTTRLKNHDHSNLHLLFITVSILSVFAIANNFIKDGITVWTPDILSKIYNTPAWLSILLTLLLPVMAIMGAAVALNLHKKTKSLILTITLLFTTSSILIAFVTFFMASTGIIFTICCLAIVSCLMSGVNNVITSIFPFSMKDTFNSGKLAGLLNGFCYVGSTLSSYTLGLIADKSGWGAVFNTLLTVNIAVVLIGITYYLIEQKKKHEKNDN